MYTILFIAWSPNSPHQPMSQGLLTSSVYLMTHSSDISSPLCHMFQQMYSFPAASWIWPESLYPVPSILIYRAFSQSQRCPSAVRAGWLWAQVILVDKAMGAHGPGAGRVAPAQCGPFGKTVPFPGTLKISWRAESFLESVAFFFFDLYRCSQQLAFISWVWFCTVHELSHLKLNATLWNH